MSNLFWRPALIFKANNMKRPLSAISSFIFCLLLCVPGVAFSFECVNTEFLFDITGDMDQPSDISMSSNGDLYFVDGVNNRVVVVNNKGLFSHVFGKKGSGAGEFNLPLGIDISPEGNVFIADTGNQRIQVFDAEGKFLYMFGTEHESDRNTSEPVDVLASDFREYLYVTDNNNHKVKVYDRKGVFQFQFGRFGEDFGEFRYPATISVSETNEVFVVDVLNTRVQKFTPEGVHITDIGSWGVQPGKFFRPKGVAVSDSDWVFVSDSYMGLIQVFSDMGRFDGVICEEGKKRFFNTPVGLHVDSKNRLYVVEMRGNEITVFKIVR